jgi:hypothetical protein
MRSKFGRGSNVGMLFPTSAATSSYVMVASISIGRELVYGRLRCVINRDFVFGLCVVLEGGGFTQQNLRGYLELLRVQRWQRHCH